MKGEYMQSLIAQIFDFLAGAFDAIPLINKLKGARSILGFIGMAVISALKAYGIGDPVIEGYIFDGLLIFCGLSLNAKSRA